MENIARRPRPELGEGAAYRQNHYPLGVELMLCAQNTEKGQAEPRIRVGRLNRTADLPPSTQSQATYATLQEIQDEVFNF